MISIVQETKCTFVSGIRKPQVSHRSHEYGENHMNTHDIRQDTKIGYTVDQFINNVVPIGRTSLYKLIKEGKLKSVLICGRRIIPATEADRLLNQTTSA